MKLDEFTEQYVRTALWSSTHQDTEEPLDDWATVDDITPEALAQMIEDCRIFQLENLGDIGDRDGQAGHDFWLTRNHHGAGFWDGDWSEPDGASGRLTENSHLCGECNLYVGDDDMIYIM